MQNQIRLHPQDIAQIVQEVTVALRSVLRAEYVTKDDLNMLKDLMVKTWRFIDGEYILTVRRVATHTKVFKLHSGRIWVVIVNHC